MAASHAKIWVIVALMCVLVEFMSCTPQTSNQGGTGNDEASAVVNAAGGDSGTGGSGTNGSGGQSGSGGNGGKGAAVAIAGNNNKGAATVQ